MYSEGCEFDLGGFTLRGVRWGKKGGVPILAAHGWLDNCASFDLLAERLCLEASLRGVELDIFAPDLAGHGKSDHRSYLGAYNIWQDVIELSLLLKELEWDQFHLLGHSRGAMITMLLAGLHSEKVKHIALIDSLFPQVIDEDKAVNQLQTSLDSLLAARERPRNYYESMDKAITARELGLINISREDAAILAKRGVMEDDNGLYWSNDPKLLAASEIKYTKNQVDGFVRKINVPIHVVVGRQGLVNRYPELVSWAKEYSNIHVEFFDGGHHLHMSEQYLAVANYFLPNYISDE